MVKKSHARLVILLGCIVVGMFGFGFALVPIYNSLCKTLGINGKVVQDENVNLPDVADIEKNRKVLVEFVATIHGGVPWAFYPKTRKIWVHPGEVAKLEFYAENKTDYKMTVQAIPSITPGIAAKYLKKTECFCFTQQALNGHEAMNMPLLFHVDVELPKTVKTITLAYTLFDVSARS
jgi:cytochrome c oxidase assembly protein subunit 11